MTAISRTVRRWALHHRSDNSLQDLAEMYNPCIRGWINYYSHFHKTQLRPTLKRGKWRVWGIKTGSWCIRGWINYYSHFHKTQLRPTLKRGKWRVWGIKTGSCPRG